MKSRNALIGKTITGLTLSDDRESISVHVKDGRDIVGEVYSECCSYTWIESVELPALGFPAVVVDVVDLELPHYPDSTFHPDSDVESFYGQKIITDRGEIIIDFRNDSNGFYGGGLDWPGKNVT